MNYTYEEVDLANFAISSGVHYIKIGDEYWPFQHHYGGALFFTGLSLEKLGALTVRRAKLPVYIRVPVVPKKWDLQIWGSGSFRIQGADGSAGGGKDGVLRDVLGPGKYVITEAADAE